MKPIAAMLLATITMIATGHADEQMDAYTDCWANVATSHVADVSGDALEHAVVSAIDKANRECNGLARIAARTNGKDAVNDMWRYMEVQFANAHLRETQR